ncbi:hypothetical protein ACFOMD_13475 [Sphingoaurantiacus capsulatus]|uniref:Uncharacterized protein n=1 Tax=Sphingoaurantiacus capsulatus TaxID=1771310 RepID=A0ABV7XDQ0_9SPHN
MRNLLIAAATAGLFLAAAPASADETCAASPSALRTAASTSADAAAAKKALGFVAIGEKLCDAGADRAAGKKFAAAAKALNVDLASLTPAAAAAK